MLQHKMGFPLVQKLLHISGRRGPRAAPHPCKLRRGGLAPQRTCRVKHRRTQAFRSSIHTDDVLLLLHACNTWKAIATARSESACSLSTYAQPQPLSIIASHILATSNQ